MSEEKRKRWSGVILLAVIIGLAAGVAVGAIMNREQMIIAIGKVRLEYLIFPFFCFIFGYFIDAVRLVMVLRTTGTRIHFREAFYNSVYGQFISNLTPSASGGQAFQIIHLQQIGVPVKAGANIILSRFVVNAMLILLVMVVSFPTIVSLAGRFAISDIVMYAGLITTFVFSILLLLMLLKPQILAHLAFLIHRTFIGRIITKATKNASWASKFLHWTHGLRDETRTLWKQHTCVMIADILMNALFIMTHAVSLYYVLCVICGQDLSYGQILVTYVIVWQVVVYIPTPGASGSLEWGFAAVFSGITGKPEATLVAIVIWRIATYYLHLLVGGIAIAINRRVQPIPVWHSPARV